MENAVLKQRNKITTFFKKYIEANKVLRIGELAIFCLLLAASLSIFIFGGVQVVRMPKEWTYQKSVVMIRNPEHEDYDEDSTRVDVVYETEDGSASLIVTYAYED